MKPAAWTASIIAGLILITRTPYMLAKLFDRMEKLFFEE